MPIMPVAPCEKPPTSHPPTALDLASVTITDEAKMIDTSSLPSAVVEALKNFDVGCDGLSVQDIQLAADKWKASQGMHDGFPLKAFPDDLQGSLKAFDHDGDGMINKAELAAAARMYRESKNNVRALGKVIVALSAVLLLTLFAIMGLVYLVVEMSKETSTGSDGTMTVKGSSEPVRVDTVESFTTVWDIPAVSTDELANMKSITVYVDMTRIPAVGGIAEATFKVAGAYKALDSTDEAFLTTAEGYTITIDGAARKGTIEMGTKGIFAISTDEIADDVTRRLREKLAPKIPGMEAVSEPFFFHEQAFLEEEASTEGSRAEDGRRLKYVKSVKTRASYSLAKDKANQKRGAYNIAKKQRLAFVNKCSVACKKQGATGRKFSNCMQTCMRAGSSRRRMRR